MKTALQALSLREAGYYYIKNWQAFEFAFTIYSKAEGVKYFIRAIEYCQSIGEALQESRFVMKILAKITIDNLLTDD